MTAVTRLIVITLVLIPVLARADTPGVTISFNEEICKFTITTADADESLAFAYEDVSITGNKIEVRGRSVIEDSVLSIRGVSANLKALSVTSISESEGFYHIRLTERQLSRRQLRRGAADIVNLFSRIEIAEREFIRGSLISIAGDIKIRGEVNGHVVSLFGDIELQDEGICHRDVFAIGGAIETSQQSRIYGAIQSTEKWKRSDIVKRRRINYGHDPIEYGPELSYNRVDGLTLGAKIEFYPKDNFVPRFHFSFGYGFESERGKYDLGFEQRIFDYNQFVFGGSVYRQTRTADEWRSGQDENSAYAILNGSDFRDYWEGEGGKLYVEQNYNYVHKLRAQISFEELDSLRSHPRLWSVFGTASGFRSNFSSLPEMVRAAGQSAFINDESIVELAYIFNSTYELEQLQPHGWFAQVNYQHSSRALDSEFSYDRYRLELRRYQPLSSSLGLNLRALYGAATGSPPIHRLFYLGGIRTLRGHAIKEFYGTRAALFNAEYLVAPYDWSIGFAVLFDIGVTGFDSEFLSDNRWKGDYGLGVWLDDVLRVEVTRPFNGSNDDLRVSILADHAF